MIKRNRYTITIMIMIALYVLSIHSYAYEAYPDEFKEEVVSRTLVDKPSIESIEKNEDGDDVTIYQMIGEPNITDHKVITTPLPDTTIIINFGTDEVLDRYPYNVTKDGKTYIGILELVSQETFEQDGILFKQEVTTQVKENTVTKFYNADGTESKSPGYSWGNSGDHPSYTENGLLFIKYGEVHASDIIREDSDDGTYTTKKTYTATYIAVVEKRETTSGTHSANVGTYEGDITAEEIRYTYTADFHKADYTKEIHLKNIGDLNNNAYVQDPVNIITGNLYAHYTDLSIINIGTTIEANRYYNSLDDRVSSLGKSWRFYYDSYIEPVENSNDISVVYPSGRGSRFHYDEETDKYYGTTDTYDTFSEETDGTYTLLLRDKQKYIYGSNHKLSKIIDPQGNITNLIYDGSNNLTKVDAGEGKYITISYNQGKIHSLSDSIGRTITYEYDDNDMLYRVIDSSGAYMAYEYEDNRITTITDKNGNVTLRNDYDNIGRVIRQVDGHGGVIEYGYDLVKKENYYHNIMTGEKVTYQYDNRFYITKKAFEDGTYEEYSYDEIGNKISIRNRNEKITKFEYDDHHNIIKIISPAPYSYETVMTYNDMGRVVSVQLPNGVTNTYTYDEVGNLLTINNPIDDNRTATTSYTYDSLGRKTTETNPLGNVIQYKYNSLSPLPTRVIDQQGNSSIFTYDNVNRIKTVTKGGNTLTYDYNYMNKITKITDPYGNVTRMKYDSMGNVIKTIRANTYNSQTDDGIGDIYYYNSMNKQTHITDAVGNIVGITRYDEAGNITKVINPDSYNESTGNGAGQQLVYDNEYRLIKSINASGDNSRVKYDPMGNVLKAISANSYNEQTDDGEGLSYTYDALNRLVSVLDKDGVIITKNIYDRVGRVIKNIDSDGYETLYQYNKVGWLIEKKEPLKEEEGTVYYRQTKYEYDLLGRKIKEYKSNDYVEVNEDATIYNTILYTYNKTNQLMSVRDSTGAYTRYDYDHLSRLTKQESLLSDGLYNTKRFEYDKLGRITKEIQVIKGEDIDSNNDYEESITTYSYDKNGNLIQVTSPLGYRTTFTYNANNQIVKKEEEVDKDWLNANHVKASIYSPKNKVYEDNVYSYQLKLDTDKAISSAHFDIVYDSRIFEFIGIDGMDDSVSVDTNTIGKIVIDSNQNYPIGKSDIISIRLKTRVQLMGQGYITFNDSCYYVDQDGDQKKFTELTGQRLNMLGPDYNENQMVEINDLTLAAKQAEQGVIPRFKYTYDTNNDGSIDTNDLEYISEWLDKDKGSTYKQVGISQVQNRIINNDYVTGTEKVIRETNYKYNKSGNLIEESDAEGIIKYTYDLQNNLIELIDKEGNTHGFKYDAEDNLVAEIKPENYDADTKTGPAVTYRYDYLGRVTHILDEDNQVVKSNIYDIRGRLIKQIDSGGYKSGSTDNGRYKTEYTYDIGGRVTSIATPEAKAVGKSNMKYTYDAQNNVITTEDGEENVTTYYRDLWGRAIAITNGMGYTSTYEYDYAGNVISSTDSKGNTTQYVYNSMNKLKKIIDPMEGEIHYIYDKVGRVVKEVDRLGQIINYQYNSEHNLTRKSIQEQNDNQYFLYNDMGRLFSTISNNGIEGYSYTPNGLIESQSSGNETLLNYTYNKNNQIKSLTDKQSYTVNYQYDSQSRLSTVSDNDGVIANYTYNNNLLNRIAYKNNVNIEYNYNKDNQISALSHAKGNNNLNIFEYDYNLNGNVTEKQEDGLITRYEYDELNQLTKVKYPNAEEIFNYDIAGNRTKRTYKSPSENMTVASYQYNPLNQLTKSVENDIITAYSYDKNGNLLKSNNAKSGTVYYSYDGYNRLTNVTNPDGSYQNNNYTVGRLRKSIEENGVYSGFNYYNGQVINEYTSHGDVKQTNIIGDRLLASKAMGGELLHYLHNAHSDVTSITNQQGKMVNNYAYDAYGNITSSEQLVKNRYTYSGEQFDKVTGQYYLRARYYDPKIGRFMQEDSYRGDGLNLYAYVANNPINYIDPSGYCKDESGANGNSMQTVEDWYKYQSFVYGGSTPSGVEYPKTQYSEYYYLDTYDKYLYDKMKLLNTDSIIEYYYYAFSATANNIEFRVEGAKHFFASSVAADEYLTYEDGEMIFDITAGYLTYKAAEGLGKSYKAIKGARHVDSPSEVQQILNKTPELTGTNREKLLSVVQDSDLSKIVNELYRPGATLGDGGTATALIDEFYSGTVTHLKKANERLKGLNKIVSKGNLGLNDLDIAEALITDLENAIKLFD